MASFNQVVLMGNLTQDPVLRYTTSGKAVAEVSLAVNHKFSVNGERREEVTFVDVTVWGRTAEVLCEYCKKGSPVLFSGRLQQERWQDKQTGANRSKLKVVADSLQLVGGRDSAAGSRSQDAGDDRQPVSAAADVDVDDIPF